MNQSPIEKSLNADPLIKRQSAENHKIVTAKSKALELAKKTTKSKCETCGRGHSNHASYVYKTGNLG